MKARTKNELRDEMLATIDGVKNGNMRADDGNVIANLAGRVIALERLDIEYSRSRKEIPQSDFLDGIVATEPECPQSIPEPVPAAL